MNDSPISHLSAVTALSADDLLLVSKSLDKDLSTYASNKIEYNDFVGSLLSTMGNDLSSIVQRELSGVVGGTVTLATWI